MARKIAFKVHTIAGAVMQIVGKWDPERRSAVADLPEFHKGHRIARVECLVTEEGVPQSKDWRALPVVGADKCKCGTWIIFVLTEENKKMPVDPQTGLAHWATCPYSDDFRSPRQSKSPSKQQQKRTGKHSKR